MQFRNITQTAATTNALEKAVNLARRLAEEKVASIVASQGTPAELAEEQDLSPEALLMLAVSGGGDAKERKDKQALQPWIKYLWETYRAILDVLRNNSKFEQLYHQTARAAFDFCVKYKRGQDFRHLCEMLRIHQTQIAGRQQQQNAVDLTAPETVRMYLETRFEQLRTAAKLELWQEAYRTIEDIHASLVAPGARAAFKPSLMRAYYQTLTDIFWASDNQLFHAYSLQQLYAICTGQHEDLRAALAEAGVEGEPEELKLTPEEHRRIATRVVVATLAVPPVDRFGQREEGLFDMDSEATMRLAGLLGFRKEVPSRAKLIESLTGSDALTLAAPEARELYQVLESGFYSPLALSKKIAPLLAKLSGAYAV